MGRFLFAVALMVSSAAIDSAFAEGGVIHLFATPPSASRLPPPSELLAGCGHGRYWDRV